MAFFLIVDFVYPFLVIRVKKPANICDPSNSELANQIVGNKNLRMRKISRRSCGLTQNKRKYLLIETSYKSNYNVTIQSFMIFCGQSTRGFSQNENRYLPQSNYKNTFLNYFNEDFPPSLKIRAKLETLLIGNSYL